MNKVNGYKAFDKDLKCRGMQFVIGKSYTESNIELCSKGFHFCENPFDVYNYHPKESFTRICEVIAHGNVKKEGDKSVTDHLEIVRELSDKEKLELWIKKTNSGHSNSGDYNSGYFNSGLSNSGHSNSGNYNSGYYNSGNYNSGFFNTTNAKVRLFNKETNLEFTDASINKLRDLMYKVKPLCQWITESKMTEQEKLDNPSYKITQGYLKKNKGNDYSAWNNESDITFFKSLPGFDAAIFKEITGIDVTISKTIKVCHNGQEFEIDVEKAKELGIIKR